MASIWACPICGSVPADNGNVNAVGTNDTGDPQGNPYHCPVCSSAMHLVNQTKVATLTGVSSGSQHPIDVDAYYTVATDSPESQFAATPYTLTDGRVVQPHGYQGSLKRGDQTVTAETINTTVGP